MTFFQLPNVNHAHYEKVLEDAINNDKTEEMAKAVLYFGGDATYRAINDTLFKLGLSCIGFAGARMLLTQILSFVTKIDPVKIEIENH